MKTKIALIISILLGIAFVVFLSLPGECQEDIKEAPSVIKSVRLTNTELPGYNLKSSSPWHGFKIMNSKTPGEEIVCWRDVLANNYDKITMYITYGITQTPEIAREALERRVKSVAEVGFPMNTPIGDESFSYSGGIAFRKGRVLISFHISDRAWDENTKRWVSNSRGKAPSVQEISDKIISRIKSAGLDK